MNRSSDYDMRSPFLWQDLSSCRESRAARKADYEALAKSSECAHEVEGPLLDRTDLPSIPTALICVFCDSFLSAISVDGRGYALRPSPTFLLPIGTRL